MRDISNLTHTSAEGGNLKIDIYADRWGITQKPTHTPPDILKPTYTPTDEVYLKIGTYIDGWGIS